MVGKERDEPDDVQITGCTVGFLGSGPVKRRKSLLYTRAHSPILMMTIHAYTHTHVQTYTHAHAHTVPFSGDGSGIEHTHFCRCCVRCEDS